MKNKNLLLLIPLLLFSKLGVSQSVTKGLGVLPSSPEASSLGKFIDFPVSPFTGTHNLSLPLYEVKVGDYTLPITLKYHSAGVKVQEIASRVGMGWALQAGGTIVCAANGRADLGLDIVVDPGNVVNNIDGGTDVFYYSFGNYSGKFIIKVDPFNGADNGIVREVIKLDSNNLKIWFVSKEQIMIVDEWANSYSFQLIENSTDRATYLLPPQEDGDVPRNEYYEITYKSAWGLRSIQLNTGQVISFNYANGASIDYDYDVSRNFVDPMLWPIGSQFSPYQNQSSLRHVSTSILSSIEYEGTTISFSYNEARQDLSGDKALTAIKVFSGGNVKSLRLFYSYSNAFNAASSPTTYAAKRLFLDSIQDVSELSNAITLYKLKYNQTSLPHRMSFNQDMWGYYNQTGNNVAVMPEIYVYPRSNRHRERYLPFKRASTEPVEIYVPGRNMKVDTALVKAGILTSITYSNGGSTGFEYEPNEFLWYPETSSNIQDAFNIKAGGVRIRRIIHTDSTKSQIIKDFEYNIPFAITKTSGAVSALPIFAYPGIAEYHQELPSETVNYYKEVLIQSVRNFTVLGSSLNSTIGYRYVTVKTTNNGKTVYQFSFPGAYGDSHDDPVKGCRVDMQGFCDNLFKPAVVTHTLLAANPNFPNRMGVHLISDSSGTYPFSSGTNYDWNRGLPIRELSYDMNNKLVQKKEYYYYTVSGNRTITETTTGDVCCGVDAAQQGNGKLVKYADAQILTGITKNLKQQREVLYSGTDSIVTVKDVSYDSQRLLISQQSITTSKSQQKIIQYRYPHHFAAGSAVYTEMVNRNMLAPVVEEKNLLGSVVLKTTTTDYDMSWFADKRLIAPKNKWEKYGTGSSIKRVEFKAYDSTGHPLSMVGIDGTYSYKWSKSGNLLAEIFNASPQENFYEGFESDSGATVDLEGANTGRSFYTGDFSVPFTMPNSRSYMVDYWYREAGKWKQIRKLYTNNMTLTEGDAIDDVRVIPSDAFMQAFSHDQLYGLTGMIDKTTTKVTYHYDNLGRLSFSRDREGNILNTYRYSYAQRPDIESATPYTNNDRSQNFTKSNCGTEYNGGTVTYKVLKGKYKSAISQADADAKAQADINANGQEYANLFGTCIEKCEGIDRKWINGVCERGTSRYTRSVWVDDAYDCYFRYYFSDGSYSVEMLAGTFPEPCTN